MTFNVKNIAFICAAISMMDVISGIPEIGEAFRGRFSDIDIDNLSISDIRSSFDLSSGTHSLCHTTSQTEHDAILNRIFDDFTQTESLKDIADTIINTMNELKTPIEIMILDQFITALSNRFSIQWRHLNDATSHSWIMSSFRQRHIVKALKKFELSG